MSYQDLARRSLEEHHLLSVLLELTYRCNLNCFFCYNDLALTGRQMALDDYERLLEDLAEMQVLTLGLSGGEPLASPVFWDVGRKARELGFMVRVKTNAHAVDAGVARRLKDEVDPYMVEVSLHGGRPETHDRQTRIPGSFERLVANLGAMSRAGLRLEIHSTLTRWNEGEIAEMFALMDGLGLTLLFDPTVVPRDDGDQGPLEISASDAGLRHFFEVSRQRRGEMPPPIAANGDVDVAAAPGKNCGAGASTLTIDPFGNVYPCVQWRRPVGNVHDRPVSEIWGGTPELDEVRGLNAAAGRSIDRRLGFCLGLAEELTGDPLTVYDAVVRTREAADAVHGVPKSGGVRLPVLD